MYAYDFRPKRKGINHSEIFIVMSFKNKYDRLISDLDSEVGRP